MRKQGETKLGIRCELKNINSFKFIGDATEYDISRHIATLKAGGTITQKTLLWDNKEKKTFAMRSKEESADYRFFEDPDLPLITIDDAWIERIRARLPELPNEKFERLCSEFGLSTYEADILVEHHAIAAYFENAYKHRPSKHLINWVLRNVIGFLNEQKIDIGQFKVTAQKLAALIGLLEEDRINNHAAQEIFNEVAVSGTEPIEVMQAKNLEQINSTEEIEMVVDAIIDANKAQVEAYRGGNERLFGFFVGQAMKQMGGKANPKTVSAILKKKLSQ